MRVRFLTSTPLNVRHGSGTFLSIQTLAKSLGDLGVAVDLITPTVRLPVYTAERLLFNEALRFRKMRPCDVEVGFDMDGYRIAGRGSIPHIASIKGVIADALPFEKGSTKATMAIQARCESAHIRRADLLINISRYSVTRLEQLYGTTKEQIVVPESIDLARWRKLFLEHPRQHRPEEFVVLCVCRFYPRKRVGVLLGAAALLQDRIPNLRVRIVGGGPEIGKLKKIWREKGLESTVRWLGDLPQSELAAEYTGCDAFCLPSVQEGFGIVFLEAMAAGKPIVAARAGASPEVAAHGILVDPDNERALADGIETLYRDAGLRAGVGERGAQFVEQFDAPRVAELFVAELRKLV